MTCVASDGGVPGDPRGAHSSMAVYPSPDRNLRARGDQEGDGPLLSVTRALHPRPSTESKM